VEQEEKKSAMKTKFCSNENRPAREKIEQNFCFFFSTDFGSNRVKTDPDVLLNLAQNKAYF
jgi:hypothetical protein